MLLRNVLLCDSGKEITANMFDGNFTCVVYADGSVWWYIGNVLSSSCALDMAPFPFDQQECQLTMRK
jgi:hypothetical protein